jgi:hypothetical protein
MAAHDTFRLVCPVCNRAVTLETSKTDEHGRAVHEDCYLREVNLHPMDLPSTDNNS